MVFCIKRILLRLLGATLLVAAGYIAFHTAKTWPRCVIAHDKHILHFSNDGRTIVTGYTGVHIGPIQQMGEYKLPLQVWDTHEGTVVKTVMQDAALAKNCTFSADRHYSMADLDQGTLLLVDWQTGAETRIPIDHPHDIRGFYFSPRADLFYLYVPGSKQPHALIDVAKGEVAVRLVADDFPALRFSGDGSRLYLLTERGVAAWNTQTRRIEGEFEGSEAVQFDRQEKRVATGIGKRTLVIWDTATFQPIARIDDTKIDLHYDNVSISPSGKLVAMFPHAGMPTKVKNDLSARVWETDTGRLVATVPLERPVWAWLHEDNQWHLFDDQEFKLVDIATSTVLWQKPAQLGRLFFFDEDFGLHANPQGTWDFFDPATGEVVVQLSFPFTPKSCWIGSDYDMGAFCTFGRRSDPPLPLWLDKWIGRYLGPSDGEVQVLDRAARRIVFQMHTSADAGAVVSKDGKTLLIYDWPRGDGAAGAATPSYRFRFYDLYTCWPWFWALGIPAALFAIALMWRRWRIRRMTSPRQAAGNHAHVRST
jgi:hypothetical protein